jgi:hypothetical protein
MPKPLTPEGLVRLQQRAAARDRTGYYNTCGAETGDPYAGLALGVVKGSEVSGRVAANFAQEVGRRYCSTIDRAKWLAISETLMQVDLAARQGEDGHNVDGTLTWRTIRDYHVAVFGRPEFNLPAFAWTAWIPLEIQNTDDDRASLWADMLQRTILPVAVETVGQVLARLPGWGSKLTGLYTLVVPTVHWHPPLATGNPGSAEFQACMSAMTQFQLDQSQRLTLQEHYALFYLDVLSTNAADLGSAAAIGPTAAWRSLRGTDTPVPVPGYPALRVTP